MFVRVVGFTHPTGVSHHHQVRRQLPSVPALGQFVLDLLVVLEALEAGALDGADVDEHVLAAVVGRDETVALGRVEPLHRSGRHRLRPSIPSGAPTGAPAHAILVRRM